jgi:uncharacterized Zn-finger protein
MGVEDLRIPLDRGGFSRRECPDCHRQFKLRWTELDGGLVVQQLGAVVHFANDDEVGEPAFLSCPYCAHRGAAGAWWTEEQRELLEKRAVTLQAEIRFEQLRHVERSLSDNPYPTFLAVAPAPFGSTFSPEPDDMRLIPLLCCGEEVKVRETWSEAVRCPYCGRETSTDP